MGGVVFCFTCFVLITINKSKLDDQTDFKWLFLSSILQVIAKLWAGFFFGVINFRNSGQFMHNIITPKIIREF